LGIGKNNRPEFIQRSTTPLLLAVEKKQKQSVFSFLKPSPQSLYDHRLLLNDGGGEDKTEV